MKWLASVVAAVSLLGGCSDGGDGPMQGYVEGVYVYIAADAAGRLVERPVIQGETIEANDLLARLDSADEEEAVAGAAARLAQARAELADLQSGKRPEEVGVIAAELARARATYNQAQEEYLRQLVLLEKAVVAQAAVDSAKASRDVALANVEAIERQLLVAKLPARPSEIEAAELNVAALEASLAQSETALERRSLRAPAAGFVEETFFEPGERVSAGAAIVSLLPDVNKKIRFFLPEARLATVRLGDRIAIDCDDCEPGLTAEIDFIASEAEYTPPVIYSKDSREKLVFRVEARPIADAISLKVGQPLDITLVSRPAGS